MSDWQSILDRLRSDAEIYQEIARFRGVPDTPLGRALLLASNRYTEAANAIDTLRTHVESLATRVRTLEEEKVARPDPPETP